MYYITLKNSKTGKKFQAIDLRLKSAHDAQKAIADELGFNKWRNGHWCVAGRFSAIVFDTPPNPKVWKRVNGNNEYMPKASSKEGKLLLKRFSDLPKVGDNELNECISFDGFPLHRIGYSCNNKKYFGFTIGDNWEVKIPKDCKEVTYTEYKKLFKIKPSK